MTKLEKRQMMLIERYQKEGIYRFVAIKGSLSGLAFACLVVLQPETFPHPPSFIQFLLCLIAGWLLGYGLWFFVMWYFGKIKKRLDLHSPEAEGKV